jgi:hypothetical protein
MSAGCKPHLQLVSNNIDELAYLEYRIDGDSGRVDSRCHAEWRRNYPNSLYIANWPGDDGIKV